MFVILARTEYISMALVYVINLLDFSVKKRSICRISPVKKKIDLSIFSSQKKIKSSVFLSQKKIKLKFWSAKLVNLDGLRIENREQISRMRGLPFETLFAQFYYVPGRSRADPESQCQPSPRQRS